MFEPYDTVAIKTVGWRRLMIGRKFHKRNFFVNCFLFLLTGWNLRGMIWKI